MIRTYKYIITDHQKLHEFVLEFFDNVEFKTEEYNTSLFNSEFYNNIVLHHPQILESKFKAIYEVIKDWKQTDRSDFCQKIRASNQIEDICAGKIKPTRLEDLHIDLRTTIDDLFNALYEKVLKKSSYFKESYGTIIDHFKELKKAPNDFLKCPACGIRDVETIYDDERDQYDHYLAKSIYPFSTVNFKNLIPICQKCNSLDVKSSKDIIKETTGFVFYPYAENHKGILISVHVIEDNINIDKMKYGFTYSNPDGRNDEIESWKYIFKIEKRHNNFVRGRIGKWYKVYWKFINNKKLDFLNEEQKKMACFAWMEEDESEDLSFVRKPALEAFIDQSALGQAQEQIKNYALYKTG